MKPRSQQPRRPSRQPRAGKARPTRFPHEIAPTDWERFLNDFSGEHEGWDSEIRIFLPNETGRIETRGLPFEGVSLDYKAGECTTTVGAGTEAADHLQRLVPRTTRILALGRDELEIDAADHSRTLVRCRRPRR